MRHYLFKFEQNLQRKGYKIVIGIDEAGRGPLAGPVVACACTRKRNSEFGICNSDKYQKRNPNYELLFTNYSKIKDSKMLTEKRREELYSFICENFHVGIGICDHKTIDRINILQATYLAMKKAITDLQKNINKCHSRESGNLVNKRKTEEWIPAYARMTGRRVMILVDGNKEIPNCSYEQRAIIGGDKLVKSISAASIIAKVTRDRIMRQMHKTYPDYCFDHHKGYGTCQHYKMLEKFGPCKIHRKSFNLMLDT